MASSSDLRVQVVLQTIDRASATLRKIQGGGSEVARALKDTRDRLRDLTNQQKAVGDFRVLRTGLRDTSTKLGEAQARVAQLAREVGRAGVPTRAMVRELDQARRAAAALTEQQQRQSTQVQALRDKLSAAGISARNLGAHERQLRADIEATTGSVRAQIGQLQAQAAAQRRMADLKARTVKGAAYAGATAGAGVVMRASGMSAARTLTSPLQTFGAHEDAMLGVARQVAGARNELGQLTPVYRAVEEQVRSLSHELPIPTTQIAEMVTAASRMEVPREQLKDFTRTAAMMATAFDAVPDQITESMGKVAKNFKMPLTDIAGLADSINYLDDNAISKGSDIIDFLNRTSGVVSTVAMSARDAAALGSTLLTLGERTETASTATNAIVQKFAAAEKGTKKFRSALKEIDLDATAVQRGMSKDATATLSTVLSAIRKLPEEKRIGVMVELVGMEHSDTLAKLVDKPEELERQRKLANGTEAQGSMAREASARNATQSSQAQMTRNRLFNLGAVVGEILAPALAELLKFMNPMLERLTAWVQSNPGLVSGILKGAIVLATLTAAVGALMIPFALLAAKALLMRFVWAQLATSVAPALGAVLVRLAGLLMGVGQAMLFVGRMLLLNPIGLAVTGIAVAAFLLYRYWGPISGFFRKLWADVGMTFDLALLWLQQMPARFTTAGADMMRGLAAGITGALGTVRDSVMSAANSALGWFKDKLGIRSPSRVFMQAGAEVSNGAALGIANRAAGVRTAALGLAAAASAALPMGAAAGQGLRLDSRPPLSAAAPAAGAAVGATYQITINPQPGMDPRAIARAVSAELDRRERAKRAGRGSALSDLD